MYSCTRCVQCSHSPEEQGEKQTNKNISKFISGLINKMLQSGHEHKTCLALKSSTTKGKCEVIHIYNQCKNIFDAQYFIHGMPLQINDGVTIQSNLTRKSHIGSVKRQTVPLASFKEPEEDSETQAYRIYVRPR